VILRSGGVDCVLAVMSDVGKEWGDIVLMSVLCVLGTYRQGVSLSAPCPVGELLCTTWGQIGDSHLGSKSKIVHKLQCSVTTVQKLAGVAGNVSMRYLGTSERSSSDLEAT